MKLLEDSIEDLSETIGLLEGTIVEENLTTEEQISKRALIFARQSRESLEKAKIKIETLSIMLEELKK